MTLVRANESDSGSKFTVLNLQMITRVECRNFDRERDEHKARVFFSDGASVVLVGADADRTVSALEDFAGYPRP